MSFGKASFLLATVIPVEARGCLHRILRVKDADSGAWKVFDMRCLVLLLMKEMRWWAAL